MRTLLVLEFASLGHSPLNANLGHLLFDPLCHFLPTFFAKSHRPNRFPTHRLFIQSREDLIRQHPYQGMDGGMRMLVVVHFDGYEELADADEAEWACWIGLYDLCQHGVPLYHTHGNAGQGRGHHPP